MLGPLESWRALTAVERLKAALLSGWFFLVVTTLWLLKPVRRKAFIDMFIDRAGKALSAIALILVIAAAGVSITVSLAVAIGALVLWAFSAAALGRAYVEKRAARGAGTALGPLKEAR